MSWLSERNREQILGMQDLLTLYDKKKFPLSSLVYSLEGKRNGMINVEANWGQRFQNYWLQLEICNALVLDAQERGSSIDIYSRECSAIKGLRNFLEESLS